MKLGCKKESPYNVDSQYIILRWLSNFFTIEISAIHVVDINLYPVLVQEQLCQHWSFSWNPNGRYRWNRTCLNEHAFFKSLSFVLTCSIAAVLYYNSPECHNDLGQPGLFNFSYFSTFPIFKRIMMQRKRRPPPTGGRGLRKNHYQ